MYIASQKKKENIAEYILYMWQVEDMIRAYKLDMGLITTHIIDKFQLDEEKKGLVVQWYQDLIDMMRAENVIEKGHLQINHNIISDLTDVHVHLVNSKDPLYGGFFFKAYPIIEELKTRQNSTIENDLEVCFSFLYGILLLKLQQKEISKETTLAMQTITNLLALLAVKYKDYKEGKLELQ